MARRTSGRDLPPPRRSGAGWLAALAALALGFATLPGLSEEPLELTPRQVPSTDAAGVAFVTSATCAGCHQAEHEAWLTSHHRHAMEHASEASVRGDFDDAGFVRDGETLLFHRRGAGYRVRIAAADGGVADLEVRFTFGWEPLQQYLVALPDGRLQALDVAWDTTAGRWFDLQPDEVLAPGDPLHWSGLQQNWNFMCADCHSTGLRRNYDPASDSFATTWAEVTIGCEACHGAGGAHVAWAEAGADPAGAGPGTAGLQVLFPQAAGGWHFHDDNPIAAWQGEARASPELAVCGACHAHRRLLAEGAAPDTPALEAFLPSLLDAGLYRPDGRQQAEVYVLGSFLQSRMAAAGVVCSDCHDAHSGALRAEGNGLCAQCHAAEVFDRPEHHHHAVTGPGAACVSCHMPEDPYMVVDWRRDHGFRVPRAALAAVPGVVDACAGCHESSAGIWAAASAAGWWAGVDPGDLQRTAALAAGRAQGVGAAAALAALASNPLQPPIVRATALDLLGANLQPSRLAVLQRGLLADDALLRLGAVRGLAALPPGERYRALAPLIADPVKAVRLEVAGALSEVPLAQLPAAEAARLAALFDEMLAVERLFLDRPESHYNIANHLARQGDLPGAERAYRAALARDRSFVAAYVNLAELQRSAGSESLALATLRQGLAAAPEAAALHYALGLALYRQGDPVAALSALEQAYRLGEEQGRYAHAYALALRERGEGPAALEVLRSALARAPNDRTLLQDLALFHAEAGNAEAALTYARRLAALEPENSAVADLLRRLGG